MGKTSKSPTSGRSPKSGTKSNSKSTIKSDAKSPKSNTNTSPKSNAGGTAKTKRANDKTPSMKQINIKANSSAITNTKSRPRAHSNTKGTACCICGEAMPMNDGEHDAHQACEAWLKKALRNIDERIPVFEDVLFSMVARYCTGGIPVKLDRKSGELIEAQQLALRQLLKEKLQKDGADFVFNTPASSIWENGVDELSKRADLVIMKYGDNSTHSKAKVAVGRKQFGQGYASSFSSSSSSSSTSRSANTNTNGQKKQQQLKLQLQKEKQQIKNKTNGGNSLSNSLAEEEASLGPNPKLQTAEDKEQQQQRTEKIQTALTNYQQLVNDYYLEIVRNSQKNPQSVSTSSSSQLESSSSSSESKQSSSNNINKQRQRSRSRSRSRSPKRSDAEQGVQQQQQTLELLYFPSLIEKQTCQYTYKIDATSRIRFNCFDLLWEKHLPQFEKLQKQQLQQKQHQQQNQKQEQISNQNQKHTQQSQVQRDLELAAHPHRFFNNNQQRQTSRSPSAPAASPSQTFDSVLFDYVKEALWISIISWRTCNKPILSAIESALRDGSYDKKCSVSAFADGTKNKNKDLLKQLFLYPSGKSPGTYGGGMKDGKLQPRLDTNKIDLPIRGGYATNADPNDALNNTRNGGVTFIDQAKQLQACTLEDVHEWFAKKNDGKRPPQIEAPQPGTSHGTFQYFDDRIKNCSNFRVMFIGTDIDYWRGMIHRHAYSSKTKSGWGFGQTWFTDKTFFYNPCTYFFPGPGTTSSLFYLADYDASSKGDVEARYKDQLEKEYRDGSTMDYFVTAGKMKKNKKGKRRREVLIQKVHTSVVNFAESITGAECWNVTDSEFLLCEFRKGFMGGSKFNRESKSSNLLKGIAKDNGFAPTTIHPGVSRAMEHLTFGVFKVKEGEGEATECDENGSVSPSARMKTKNMKPAMKTKTSPKSKSPKNIGA